MLGNVFQSLFGGSTQNTRVQQPDQRLPFDGLERFQRGLAAKVRHYILTGDDPSFPAGLAHTLMQAGHPGGYIFTSDCKQLAHAFGRNPDGLVRLVQVHAALGCTNPKSRNEQKHQEPIPEGPARLFDLFRNNAVPKDIELPTTIDDVIDAVRALGGSETDVVAVLLPPGRFNHVPNVSGAGDYIKRIGADILISALERCDAKFRTLALEKFRAKHAEATAEFADFLFRQFEETSEGLREAALKRLETLQPDGMEKRALARLDGGKAVTREIVARILGKLETTAALAALEERRKVEKVQSVLTTIDTFLATTDVSETATGNGYVDIHGNEVRIPDLEDLVDDGRSPLGADFAERLQALDDAAEAEAQERHRRALEYWQAGDRKNAAPQNPTFRPIANAWLDALNTPVDPDAPPHLFGVPWRHREAFEATIDAELEKLPPARVIALACRTHEHRFGMLTWKSDSISNHVQAQLATGEIGLRQVLSIAERMRSSADNRLIQDKETTSYAVWYLENLLRPMRGYGRRTGKIYPDLWEVAATRLDTIMAALPPRTTDVKVNLAALEVVATFPTLPHVLLQPVLTAAIDERPKLQRPAQALLTDAPGVDALLIKLIDDKKQGIRANAARFLAKRGAKESLPALTKRLKKERSEYARAELISAIAALGGDVQLYLGKDALLEEAKTLVGKLPDAKIAWLNLDQAPTPVWADGRVADPVVLDAWLRLGLKLKSPAGSPLFRLYFEQLKPDSAAAISEWVLDSWIGYDTHLPSPTEIAAAAETKAKAALASGYNWHSHEQWVAHFTREIGATYINSAAERKGILALTHFAPPASACPKIAAYLKNHGRRVSQAKSLVETLFGMGSRDAVQVLVATSTRFKQRTVRELAETLVKDLADARGWTEDALADRSVPTGGFEDDGVLALPIGEEEKPYRAVLGSDLTVRLFNPDGKEVKSLPAGKDENTKSSKALLSAARKTIKAVKAQQEARLYEAMLTPRIWEIADWRNDLTTHPIFKRLIERVIWRGLDADGTPVAALRLTAEGECLDAEGDDVDLSLVAKLDLAHTANLSEADREAWRQHLKDFEVSPLFEQVTRPLHALSDAQLNSRRLEDRQGWLMTTFKLRGAAKKLGYERGPIEDGGGFQIYRKAFRGAGLWADLYFSGSYVGEEDFNAAIDYMQFTRMDNASHGRAMQLGKVPPLLLSEVWNDLHQIAKAGAFDPDWKKKGLY